LREFKSLVLSRDFYEEWDYEGGATLGTIPSLGTIHAAAVAQHIPFPLALDLATVSRGQHDFFDVLRELHAHRYGVVLRCEQRAEIRQVRLYKFSKIADLSVNGILAAADRLCSQRGNLCFTLGNALSK
jgi:hypothetical protein